MLSLIMRTLASWSMLLFLTFTSKDVTRPNLHQVVLDVCCDGQIWLPYYVFILYTFSNILAVMCKLSSLWQRWSCITTFHFNQGHTNPFKTSLPQHCNEGMPLSLIKVKTGDRHQQRHYTNIHTDDFPTHVQSTLRWGTEHWDKCVLNTEQFHALCTESANITLYHIYPNLRQL